MLRLLFMFFIFTSITFSATVEVKEWKKGMTLSSYLTSNNLPLSLIDKLSKEDKTSLSKMDRTQNFYELRENGILQQALIHINDELQIQLTKSKTYNIKIIPIVYENKEFIATIKIEKNIPLDIKKNIGYERLANRVAIALKGVLDTTNLKKGEEVSLLYTQKIRLGKPFLDPQIKAISYKPFKGKEIFIYVDSNGYGHKEPFIKEPYKAKQKKKFLESKIITPFTMPLKEIKVSSSFSKKRWHPILKEYKPHHGTDFSAKYGTPIYAIRSGKVIFAGINGGYGKVVKIRHTKGYTSFYAHQSKIKVKSGQNVAKGEVIGYIGSTGRSTGPHLHLGLMKNDVWLDPMSLLGKKEKISYYVTKDIWVTKYKKIVIKGAIKAQKKLKYAKKNINSNYIWKGKL